MVTLTADQIRDLLSRVANQPGFRADLESDPRSALDSIKQIYDDDDIPVLPEVVTLPSDSDISNSLDALTSKVVGNLSHIHALLLSGEP